MNDWNPGDGIVHTLADLEAGALAVMHLTFSLGSDIDDGLIRRSLV